MKRGTISARADGAVCIGREAVPVGVFLITSCTSAVPHNITLFVKFEITFVPKSICGLFIDQRSKSFPVASFSLVKFSLDYKGLHSGMAAQPIGPNI